MSVVVEPRIRSRPVKGARAAELALAVGGFGIGTGEFASMGLLPNVATGLDVSVPTAGHIISAYALGVVVGAPLIAVLGARISRRTLVLVLMAVFALGNIASTLAPSYGWLVVLRDGASHVLVEEDLVFGWIAPMFAGNRGDLIGV